MSHILPEKALIYRIVHRDNLAWILRNGLHCRSSEVFDRNYVNIGNVDLILKRESHEVPIAPGGALSDYVPFYFTPHSPMLYNIKTGWGGVTRRANDEIHILVSSLPRLRIDNIPFIYTDRHAYLRAAQFFSDIGSIDRVDWPLLQSKDFRRDPEDPGKFERYQAEALVHRHLPCSSLLGIVCFRESDVPGLKAQAAADALTCPIVARPGWYF
ncbi:DUF4433 domain-containing protein [Bosea sp. (in: a-proteobacteria)]|jgi:hypothetical protein|uniref:type II toxin-antitoxin system toxin DNA ADP-ribosyl transferase DarT n=1 Tax=Bosea sp. (in: a-proteobacteria) TaxID=1871050 RepID=UPI0035671AF5